MPMLPGKSGAMQDPGFAKLLGPDSSLGPAPGRYGRLMAKLVTLDPESGDPLYRQVRWGIEKAISAGQFANGRLPSSRVLAVELGVSRNTVQLAYQELVAEGYVSSEPRSGLVVNREMRTLVRPRVDDQEKPLDEPHWSSLLARQEAESYPHIRKPADWHRYPYPFIGGQIDVDSFPRIPWLNALRKSLEPAHSLWSLKDGQSTDDPLLIQAICQEILPSRGINARPEEVLVTMGSQEGLYLAATALCRPLMEVVVENPGYPDAWHILARAGARLVPKHIDEAGIVIDDSLRTASLVYLTPSHQFPTNTTLSIARRKKILEMATQHNIIVLEDDYDSELRYQGHPTPALKALDERGRVVYFGSFSKFLAPGLRLGFVVGHPELITELRILRRYTIRHPPGHLQRALALLIRNGDYSRSLRRLRATMKLRWQCTAEAVDTYFPSPVDIPAGGTCLWVRGPEHLDTKALAIQAQPRGVLFEPGEMFFMGNPHPANYLRLGYAAVPFKNIVPGVQLLGSMMRQQDGRRPVQG